MQRTKYIALVNSLPQLVARREWRSGDPVIEIAIGVLKEEDGKTAPRNWHLDYNESPKSRGGCEARLYGAVSSDKPDALFGYHGPAISYGNLRNYQHAVKALKLIEKGLEYERQIAPHVRAVDAVEALRRWLYACNLKGENAVWMRPEGYSGSGLLTAGPWLQYSIEEFVDVVRTKLPTKVE